MRRGGERRSVCRCQDDGIGTERKRVGFVSFRFVGRGGSLPRKEKEVRGGEWAKRSEKDAKSIEVEVVCVLVSSQAVALMVMVRILITCADCQRDPSGVRNRRIMARWWAASKQVKCTARQARRARSQRRGAEGAEIMYHSSICVDRKEIYALLDHLLHGPGQTKRGWASIVVEISAFAPYR